MKQKLTEKQKLILRRIAALFFDGIIILFILFLAFWLMIALPESFRLKYATGLATAFVILILTLKPIYEITFYLTKGQSLGKNLFGLQVVSFKTKAKLSTLKIILREISKFIFYSLIQTFAYVFDLIKVSVDPNSRSLSDLISGSQVISITNNFQWRRAVISLLSLIIIFILSGMLFIYWLFETFNYV